MRKFFLSLSLLSTICSSRLIAQRELLNPLIDSKEIIAKGVAFHDQKKYKEAIAEYLKVPASDTSYAKVLHELILSHYSDSNFVAAEKYGDLAMKLFPDKFNEWYAMLADIYDDTERPVLAFSAYDTILAHNPYEYRTHFNRGIAFYRQKKYDDAMASFKRCLLINPYHASSHYFMGQLAMLKGDMVSAMLSLAANLLVDPGNRYQKNAINSLTSISEVNTTVTELLQKYKPGKEDNFEEIQDILVGKIALNKKYKLEADLEDPIVRQLQVVIEKLEFNAGDKGFWMQFYVPIFKMIWEKGHFEPFVFDMFSVLDIKKVKDYRKKETKKTKAFSDAAIAYLNEIRETEELQANKRAGAATRYYIKDYRVNGKGAYGRNAKNEEVVTAAWEFYYENGALRSKGSFDSEGQRIGEWKYYYESGILKEISNFSKDLANGKTRAWYDNGILSNTTTYVDDNKEGEEIIYFYNGRISTAINYKSGKREGVAKFYNVDGYLRTVDQYSDDKQNGDETVYHPNGKILYTVKYLNDLEAGEYKEYFDNGKLRLTGNFAEGKKTGTWKTYFIDGKPAEVQHFVNGELDGENTAFYENGKMSSKRFYRKGEIDGKKEDFDDDGIVYYESIFEKGRLRDIKFFDKKGTVISNTTSRKGNADITFYDADGNKTSQGYYSKEGLAEGKYFNYFRNGTIASECTYKNGLLEGKKTYYYSNKKISQEGSYVEDKEHGYFINYYNNGQVSGEGWYVDGERQGTFINYDLLGNITTKTYYLDGKVHGFTDHFTPSGKLDYEEFHDNSWLTRIDQYDTTGKLFVSSPFPQGAGKLRFNLLNGKPYVESDYKYYELNGTSAGSNGDGSKRYFCYYKNGDYDSLYTGWYPNGKIQVQGKYDEKGKTGTWKYFYQSGQLSELEIFIDGKLDGEDVSYNEDGTIDKKTLYKNGETVESKLFGDNGQLMVVYYYKNNDIAGYSYEDKTGKLLPMIPLLKGSGVVESFYKNGAKSVKVTYSEGSQEGARLMYYSNGKDYVTGTRVIGLDNGQKKVYYANGKIMSEENYLYGEQHGLYKHYAENGQLVSELNFYLGKLHGECKYYTAGKLSHTYVYYYGEMQSKK